MLMITSFANPRVAQAFVDYMATQGIILTIQQHTQSDIWLADESQAGRVQAELARFLSVLIACIAVFVLQTVIGDQPIMLLLAWPYDPSLKFEVWRYFSHALMHFSLMHILFNLLWWWYLGGAVEKRIGSGKLVVITVISALLSGFAQHQFSGPWFGGLSGVVYALMGYVWLRGERDPQSGVYLQRGLILFSLVWLIAGWFDVFGMSIANGAHVAGLVTGLAMAFVDTQNVRKRT